MTRAVIEIAVLIVVVVLIVVTFWGVWSADREFRRQKGRK